jgi:hypothetical protein
VLAPRQKTQKYILRIVGIRPIYIDKGGKDLESLDCPSLKETVSKNNPIVKIEVFRLLWVG